MARRTTNPYALMTDSELEKFLWNRYQQMGISGLSYSSLRKIKGLYHVLHERGYGQRRIIERLGLQADYQHFKENTFTKVVDGEIQQRWSWDRVIESLAPIVDAQGFLPPAQWLNANGLGSLVQYVYNSQRSWGELRVHFGSFDNSDFIVSRNGLRWKSRPEASLSNFLYARGIEHKTGEKYPKDYAKLGAATYGYYDLHFRATSGEWIDVEIWGDKPKGHNEDGYALKRQAKEAFNQDNPHFLGIHFADCYEDARLTELLTPLLGIIEPFVFDKPEDHIVQTTHWTDSDELIAYCRQLALEQPDGIFPTEEWLRKRGKWKDREGSAYNTVSVYIKNWLGGVRNLRKILGQAEHSTATWTRETAIAAYQGWYDEHGFTTGQVRRNQHGLSADDRKRAQNITAAVEAYFGSVAELNNQLGIQSPKLTKWSRKRIMDEASRIHARYDLTPNQIAYLDADDKLIFAIEDDDWIISRQIASRLKSYFTSANELYYLLKIEPVDLRILRRQRRNKNRKN